MGKSPQRSLRHEYELYVEQEIEAYKDSLPRSALLKIGDEAVSALRMNPQFALTEMLVWEQVDRIIMQRLRIPTDLTWRCKRLKILMEYCRPEHWGICPDSALVRAIKHHADSRVLVTGADSERAALYLAAQGWEVYAMDQTRDVVERVLNAAE